MNRKLSQEDGRAVDALLDHANGSIKRLAHPVSAARLKRLEKLLSNLDGLPAVDPPAGLAARTIALIAADQPKPVLQRSSHGHAARLMH